MLVEEMVLDFGSEVVGPAAKMDEALRLASQAPLRNICRSRPASG